MACKSCVVWYYIRMLTTFDECYDHNRSYLILAALFNPKPKQLHRKFLKAKQAKRYIRSDGKVKEIKYSYADTPYLYSVAVKAIDCFVDSSATFRAIVIDQRPSSGFNLDRFGASYEPKSLREARAYKKFTELLLKSNIPSILNGVLLTDKLTRCKGDAFMSLIKELFGTPGCNYSAGLSVPIFRHIQEVDTALEEYHVGQIGDILQGVILNELIPTKNRWKRKLREYAKQQLGLSSLGPDYWRGLAKWGQDLRHPKYQIWYWEPY